ncbi:MAG TPA: heat-shock protein [Bdellovibrionales bacterium]|nr:MAG: hypothetical protein A2Z97_11870 [Bdellovibrionales bacterium GWB1_52_6]OFZ05342.1 MAG: hypothetical protein A2X97_16480 [Bdellovibrionales bacterium GWA1_52_35]OFZ43321.1 MAG: hypothetical protein A2070_02835 [Bdellovibrionales bacterium GWC1_52_8]HAR41794.1 heat-shock protein [Bdellovibrionales bacterium]HCM39017.1 heat-shock protein [Bdellovibrionales bacterium]
MNSLFVTQFGMDQLLERNWQPACDLEESRDHYLMTLELPGIPKEQIRIECADNQIMISGERNRDSSAADGSLQYFERRYGKFQRSVALPSGVNADRIEANYQDGVLRLYIPKPESAKPRQIKINQPSGGGFFEKFLGASHACEAKAEGPAYPA